MILNLQQQKLEIHDLDIKIKSENKLFISKKYRQDCFKDMYLFHFDIRVSVFRAEVDSKDLESPEAHSKISSQEESSFIENTNYDC